MNATEKRPLKFQLETTPSLLYTFGMFISCSLFFVKTVTYIILADLLYHGTACRRADDIVAE
jgi:hypothetical protein